MQPTKVDSYKPIRCRVNKTNYKQLNYTIMRTYDVATILSNKGYKVAFDFRANCYLAYKGQRTYKSDSLNGLYKTIFGL